ncbi:MAG: hypothetical protein SNJ78_11725 [Spirochaetales bacterium]
MKEFSKVPLAEILNKIVQSLQQNGIEVYRVKNRKETLKKKSP